jgi:hypothetical protein
MGQDVLRPIFKPITRNSIEAELNLTRYIRLAQSNDTERRRVGWVGIQVIPNSTAR